MEGLLVTPFHSRTAALCRSWNWRRWAGYAVAGSYDLVHDWEYHAVRNSAAAFDVSPLYKYEVRGRDAGRLLDRIVTRRVSGLAEGRVAYTPWCDERGKVLDDGTVARIGENHFRVTSGDPNYRWFTANAVGMDATIEDTSRKLAALAVQGPNARVVLERAMERELGALRYFSLTTGSIRGVPVTVTRTGYTGDLGYEIWIPAESAVAVWDAILEEGQHYGLLPAGLLALDMARIEAGLLLLDVDYISARKAMVEGQTSTPLELRLEWTVAFDKQSFVGKEALLRQRRDGVQWRLVGIEVEWESLERLYGEYRLPVRLPSAAWRGSVPLFASHRGVQVGYATSGCWSPLLKKYIALAHVRSEWGSPGTVVWMHVTVEHRPRLARASVAPIPFFEPHRKRQ